VRAALMRNQTSLLPGIKNRSIPSFASLSAGRRLAKEGGMPMPSDVKEAERMIMSCNGDSVVQRFGCGRRRQILSGLEFTVEGFHF